MFVLQCKNWVVNGCNKGGNNNGNNNISGSNTSGNNHSGNNIGGMNNTSGSNTSDINNNGNNREQFLPSTTRTCHQKPFFYVKLKFFSS